MFSQTVRIVERSVCPIVARTPNPSGSEDPDKGEVSTGTAFCIGKGLFLTAAHVVLQKNGAPGNIHQYIYIPDFGTNQARGNFEVLEYDIERDLAVLKAKRGLGKGCPPLSILNEPRLPPSDDPQITRGRECGILSFPLIYFETINGPGEDTNNGTYNVPRGTLRFQRTSIASISWHRAECQLITDSQTYPGSSGGPLFLNDGKVIGLLRGSLPSKFHSSHGILSESLDPRSNEGTIFSLWTPGNEITRFLVEKGIELSDPAL